MKILRTIFIGLLAVSGGLLIFPRLISEPFSVPQESSPVERDSRPIITVFGGDMMLGRMVNWKLKQTGDYESLFSGIKDIWHGADVVMFNLESPLYRECKAENSVRMRFCAEPVFARVLREAGVTHISFANNHTLDYGKLGVDDTNSLLETNSITVVNQPIRQAQGEFDVITQIRDKKIGFLSWNLTWGDVLDEEIRFKIQDLRSKTDFLVVNFHWGEEYQDEPSESQKYIGRLAIESGADVVIGHHPHHIQPVEEYQGRLIFYSLGNLVFDQLWSEKTSYGMLTRVEWNPQENTLSYTTSTTYMKDWAEVECMSGCRDSSPQSGIPYAGNSN